MMAPRCPYFILFFSPITIVPVGRPAHVTDVDQPFHHVPSQQSSTRTECSIRGDSILASITTGTQGTATVAIEGTAQHHPKQLISPLINGTRGHHSSSIPVLWGGNTGRSDANIAYWSTALVQYVHGKIASETIQCSSCQLLGQVISRYKLLVLYYTASKKHPTTLILLTVF